MRNPTEITAFADRLCNFLKRARESKEITPEHPKTSTWILEYVESKTGMKFSDSDFRKAVHYLRTVKGELIISISGDKDKAGYAYGLSVQEFMQYNEHLLNRARDAWQAYYTPLKRHSQDNELLLPFKDDPVVQELQKQFNAVVVN